MKRRLGAGGMAEVFEGVLEGELGFRRRVAIKRLLPSVASDESVAKMFLEEARIASALHHGGIVAIHDYGILDGVPFQVLELVDGMDAESLSERGRELVAPIPVDVAVYIVLEIARALEYAHTRTDERGAAWGVVHRDVKPANILVSWSGDVKLGDFGIAFARDRERTIDGVTKGTPAYMAPEQLLASGVDARTDIFALGCSLHTLLTGSSPIEAQDNLRSLLLGDPLALSPALPPDLEAVVAKAVHGSASHRYGSAASMGAELAAWLATHAVTDPKASLLAWLQRIRDGRASKPEPARGRFDALLEFELAPSPAVGNGDVPSRTFRRTTARAATKSHASVEPPGTATMPVTEEPLPTDERGPVARSSPRVLRRGLAALAALVALAGVGYGTSRLTTSSDDAGGQREPEVRSSAPSSVDSATPKASSSLAPLVAPPESIPSGPSSTREASSASPVSNTSSASAGRSHASRGHGHLPTSVPSSSASAELGPASLGHGAAPSRRDEGASETGLGTVAVGGAGAVRGASIVVDGHPRGLAPKYLDLGLGDHRIELIAPDGSRTGPETVRVDAVHTRSLPLRWPR